MRAIAAAGVKSTPTPDRIVNSANLQSANQSSICNLTI
jgi:hypothetical protein